jgi:sec-independent protein translocase protein TatA
MIEGMFQPMHMLVVFVIALVFFGPKKLPELGSGLGKAIREFKKAMAETQNPALGTEHSETTKLEQTQTDTKSV